MIKCFDCNIESKFLNSWYAEYTPNGKVMRCAPCGIKEQKRREKLMGYPRKSFENIEKDDRIQYAKNLRENGLSPWQWKKADG